MALAATHKKSFGTDSVSLANKKLKRVQITLVSEILLATDLTCP